LYKNLDWLAKHQEVIEQKLYQQRYDKTPCSLFLYDVTSSYFEGECNELAAFGYNRDKKRGKKQIVVGLLCDSKGTPVSVEVFEGNTNDTKTMHNQITKTSRKFHAQKVVFVGDRGMIKNLQQKELTQADFDFITALTKRQIEKLIREYVIQLSLFDENLSEIILENGKRYILKRNPVRAKEISDNRRSKLSQLHNTVSERNNYLTRHQRAKPEVALNYCNDKLKRLKLDGWIELRLSAAKREIELVEDSVKLEELSRLDGCYCLTTSLTAQEYDKEFVHSRYKDLAMVENAFRTCKTGQLELRPIYVRKEGRTRAHVLVVMLSYLLVRKLRKSWSELDMTVEEGLGLLETLCTTRIQWNTSQKNTTPIIINRVPEPREDLRQLFQLADIPYPEIIPAQKTTKPATRKKLKKTVDNKKIQKI
jgi:transposase